MSRISAWNSRRKAIRDSRKVAEWERQVEQFPSLLVPIGERFEARVVDKEVVHRSWVYEGGETFLYLKFRAVVGGRETKTHRVPVGGRIFKEIAVGESIIVVREGPLFGNAIKFAFIRRA